MDKAWIVADLEQNLYDDVCKDIACAERVEYETTLDACEKLYLAQRSVKGLESCEEGEALAEPFEGCSDIGNPIELTMIQELVPSVMQAHIVIKPITETVRLGDTGYQPAGEVDDFLYHELVHRGDLINTRRKTLLSGYKFGEGIEKVILHREARFLRGTRKQLVSGSGEKKKILINPDTKKPYEMAMWETLADIGDKILNGQDVRSAYFIFCREQLRLPKKAAQQASGVDLKSDDEIRLAPFSDQMAMMFMQGQQMPQMPIPADQIPGAPKAPEGAEVPIVNAALIFADWTHAATYRVEDVPIEQEVEVYKGVQIINVPTVDFIVTPGVKSNDIMAMPRVTHRYWESLDWLEQRKDEPEFIKENVEKLIEKFNLGRGNGTDQHSTTNISGGFPAITPDGEKQYRRSRPEIHEVYTRRALAEGDQRETEIIAWFSPDADESVRLLGWAINPAVEFECHHIRPFFNFQPKPENDRWHGLSVPETGYGMRSTLDWIVNNRLNRDALYTDPRRIVSPEVLQRDGAFDHGPGSVTLAHEGERDEYVQYPRSEGVTFQEQSYFIEAYRLMWGAFEYMSGAPQETKSKTFGEAQLITMQGAKMFQDSVESLCQTADKELEYVRQLLVNSAVSEGLEFGSQKQRMKLTRQLLEGDVVIQSRRMLIEQERQVRFQNLRIFVEMMANVSPGLVQHPQFVWEVTRWFKDLMNLETLKNYTPEEIGQAQAAVMDATEDSKRRQTVIKTLDSITNRGHKKQIEEFLRLTGMHPEENRQSLEPGDRTSPGNKRQIGAGGNA